MQDYITWDLIKYKDAAQFYREVIVKQPRINGVIDGAETFVGALVYLGGVGLYLMDPSEDFVHVDNWRINDTYVTHRHPEFGVAQGLYAEGVVEVETRHGKCNLCGEQMPGEIGMMHSFYKLPG